MNKYKKYTGTFIAIVVIFIIVMISYFLFDRNTNNFNNLKEDQSKDLVYTESETQYGYYYQYKPYVNIKGELGYVINNDIETYMSNFHSSNIGVTYDADLSGKVLSIILKVEDYSFVEGAAILYFRSYNINLDTEEILSNEALFSYFDLTTKDVEGILNYQIEQYYYLLSQEGKVDGRCDYDCFLESRDFTSGIDDVEFYVKDGKLIAYKPFTYMSNNLEEEKEYGFNITE